MRYALLRHHQRLGEILLGRLHAHDGPHASDPRPCFGYRVADCRRRKIWRRRCDPGGEIPRQLHLHSRSLSIAHPDGGGKRNYIEAPLPPHMQKTWKLLGFDERDAKGAFDGLEV